MKLPFLLLFVIAVMPAQAAMKAPDSYQPGQCELIAKDYQREFGGSLIWLQPLQKNGAFENLGEISGHIINKAWSKQNGTYYVDWYAQEYFKNETEVKDWYYEITDKKVKIFDLSKERPPFPILWSY